MKNKFYLSFRELDNVLNEAGQGYSWQDLKNGDYNFREEALFSNRFYSKYIVKYMPNYSVLLNFYDSETSNKLTSLGAKLINKVFIKFQNEGVCSVEDESTFNDIVNYGEDFVYRFISTFDEVYLRYSILIDLYNDNLNTLIGKLQSVTETSSTSGSSTSTSHNNTNNRTDLFKDTPITSVVPSNNSYNTNETYSSGGDSGSSSSRTDSGSEGSATTTFDKDLVINQINDVQEKLRNLEKDFVKEFEGLFFELANYKEA